jgi:ribonuclease D
VLPPAPILVSDRASFEELVGKLERCAEAAIDTEADSFYSYREKVCLVQVSTDETDYIIDPLAPIELRALSRAFASPGLRKVFHDAEYDVSLLKAAGVGEFRNLFDTRIGVALLGSRTPGLSNVLRERYGIELDKSQQRSDWRRRPLTPEQLDYARHDTRHLLRLARDVERELEERRLGEIFRFECDRVAALPARRHEFDPDACLRYRGARELDPDGLSALRELVIARDALARERDVAPFRVVANELLVLLARVRPRDRHDIERVRALPPRVRSAFGAAALGAISRARARGPWVPPRKTRPEGDEVQDAVDRLKRWRTARAADEGIDASAILNRHVLEAIARSRPKTLEELGAIPGIAPWQLDRFGPQILEVVETKGVEPSTS